MFMEYSNHEVQTYMRQMASKMAVQLTQGTSFLTGSKKPTPIAQNPISGEIYSDIRSIFLDTVAAERGYKDPRWITQQQLNETKEKIGEVKCKKVFDLMEMGMKPNEIEAYRRPVKVPAPHAVAMVGALRVAEQNQSKSNPMVTMYNLDVFDDVSKHKLLSIMQHREIKTNFPDKGKQFAQNTKCQSLDQYLDAANTKTGESLIARETTRYCLARQLGQPFETRLSNAEAKLIAAECAVKDPGHEGLHLLKAMNFGIVKSRQLTSVSKEFDIPERHYRGADKVQQVER